MYVVPKLNLTHSSSRHSSSLPLSKDLILDPNDSLFYVQFSSARSAQELGDALHALMNMDSTTLAMLHFPRGTHGDLHTLIIKNMQSVCSFSRDGKAKGLVFLHLIKSINKIQHEIKANLHDDEQELDERSLLLQNLETVFHWLNKRHCFMWLDLRKRDLSHVDMSGLDPDLLYTNFSEAYMYNTNFANADLSYAEFYAVDLSTATGVGLDQLKVNNGTAPGFSEETEKSGRRCIIS